MLILTREQVRRVDAIAVNDFYVPGIVLMENASRGVVEAIERRGLARQRVLVLCGGGNNGGDGMAVARLLANAGSDVTLGYCTDPSGYRGDADINARIVGAMELQSFDATDPAQLTLAWQSKPTLIIDAIFGTGLSKPPRPPFDDVAAAVEASRVPVVAVDLPSGVDCDSGRPVGPRAVRASLTVTFVAMKLGLTQPAAAEWAGEVTVADIGCPRAAIKRAVSGEIQAKSRTSDAGV